MTTQNRKKKWVRDLSSTLPELLKDKGWEVKFDQHRVFPDWEKLVDETISEHAKPLKVVKNVLWLEVENSAWMHQLQYQKVILLETLNEYLTVSRFSDIRFVLKAEQAEKPTEKKEAIQFIPPGAESIEAFEKQISFIEDEKIRDSLMRFWYLSQACQKQEK